MKLIKNLRLLSVFIIILMLITAVSSAVYALENTGHSCDHRDCAICLHIDKIINTTREAVADFGEADFLCKSFNGYQSDLSRVYSIVNIDTPVSLKVRLNN